MKCINVTGLRRKSGRMGHPNLRCHHLFNNKGLGYVSLRLVWELCAFLPCARLDRLL